MCSRLLLGVECTQPPFVTKHLLQPKPYVSVSVRVRFSPELLSAQNHTSFYRVFEIVYLFPLYFSFQCCKCAERYRTPQLCWLVTVLP